MVYHRTVMTLLRCRSAGGAGTVVPFCCVCEQCCVVGVPVVLVHRAVCGTAVVV